MTRMVGRRSKLSSEAGLRGRLSRVKNFYRHGGPTLVAIHPPAAVVKDILALGQWHFPCLNGVVEVPVLTPGGRIIDRPGYDPASRLYYWPAKPLKVSLSRQSQGRIRHPDLKAWVGGNRGEIIAALLTLARAWFSAGQPAPSTAVPGGYESWATVVGGILEHAGIAGFLSNLQNVYEKKSG